jgi:non-specific serine/threonine protein kinase
VAAQLRARELLLVLDNCEHVVDRAAGVVDRLLRECSDVKVLATSRELLRVRGEQAFPVPQFDEAVELFAVRARSAVPGFDVDAAGRDTVEQICAQLDRLPLAIELAAARLRSLSVRQIADRLDDRFRLLTTGDRTSDPRRQTLEAVVAWSYDLLDEIERAVFRRVAVLVDSFGLDAAEQIAGWGDVSPAEVLDVIARLADKSLLTTKAAADGYRYALLETLRHYGRRRLEASGEGPATRAHLVGWAVGWAERLEAVMRTPAQDELIAASLAERANIRAAFVCAAATDQYVTALRIAAAIPIMLTPERRDAIEQLLVKASDADERERAFALMAVSNLSFELGDWDRGRASAAEAARNFARTGNARLEAWANWFVILGDWESGGPTFRAGALALVDAFTALDDELGLAYALWAKSFATEDLAEADACAARADALFRRLGSPVGLGHTIEGRALLALRFDDVARAQPFLVEALAVFAGAQNVGCTAHVLEAVAAWLVAAGDEDEAGVMLGAAEELRRAVGQARRPWEREGHTRTEVRLGGRPGLESARARGRALAFDEAVRRAEAALDLVRERE